MNDANQTPPKPHPFSGNPTVAAFAQFLRHCAAARLAAGSLREGAEVGITFTDSPGEWRFRAATEPDGFLFEAAKAVDPDFDLRIAPGAVASICSRTDAELGDLGVAFFEHIVARDPERKIRVRLHSGLVKLSRRGWLALLAKGGTKVVAWMAGRGLRGAGAVASALGKLKN